MSTDDIDKMMRNYREKALASRTRYQRFVDTFSLVPITVYFILMVILEYTTGYGLVVLERVLRLFTIHDLSINVFKATFLADLQLGILIHLWFVNPVPPIWSQSPWTGGAIGVLVGLVLFAVYFISRAVAYREVYYLDLGFLAFFVLGLALMFVAPTVFGTLYYYFPGTLIFSFLAIAALLTTAVKKPFSFQHVQRLFPKEVKETDVYKKIHYAIAGLWGLIFTVNAILGYITYYIPVGWLWLALFVTPPFFLLFGWAFMTHFPAWYTRRALKTKIQKASTPLPRLTRIVGAALILFAVLTFLLGYGQITSTSAISNMVLGFVISPEVGILETVILAGSAQISSILGILDTIVPIILMVSGVGIILGKKWGWYLTMGGLVSYMVLPWLGWVFPNVGIADWIGSFSNFYSALAFQTPFEVFFFLAVVLSGISSVFFCYLFPKRNRYIL
nr:hypothetical protein [Candidatus Freyarchaeota archaeon]